MTAGSSPSNAMTCTIQPKMRGRKRPPTARHASAVAIGDFGPNTGFPSRVSRQRAVPLCRRGGTHQLDRKSTRLNSSHSQISYAVFCLKKKKKRDKIEKNTILHDT